MQDAASHFSRYELSSTTLLMARAWLRAGAAKARARRGKAALATAAMAQKTRLRSEVRYSQLLSGSATGASNLWSACIAARDEPVVGRVPRRVGAGFSRDLPLQRVSRPLAGLPPDS